MFIQLEDLRHLSLGALCEFSISLLWPKICHWCEE